MNISFLLGAGFSIAAGYPTAKQLSEYIVHTSGHDFYIGAGNLLRRPQNIPYQKFEMIPFENLLSLIRFYSYAHCNQFNYEHFYDFYAKLWHLSDSLACTELDTKIKAFNLLYQQLLCFYLDEAEKKANEYLGQYAYFKNFVLENQAQNKIYIHTLNHDTLVERILETQYSDGFSTDNSLFLCDKKIIPMFSNENFQGNVLLYKLHGSLDRYRFTYQNDIMKYEYIKVPLQQGINLENIRNRNDIDKPCLQCLVPDFLTGSVIKIQRYQEPFYQFQIAKFKENLCGSDKVYILGYGGRDKKINDYLLECAKDKQIYIVDPYPNDDLRKLSKMLGEKSQIIRQKAEIYKFN